MMRVVFIGASSFGLKCLDVVQQMPGIEIVGVVSNSEVFSISYNKQGVTNVLYSDFSVFSKEKNIPFYRMEKNMKEEGIARFLSECKPDAITVVGWYHLIPENILNAYLCIGIHASLLPDYSGGAPLVWAIINGETKTGITLFKFDKGVDSGDIIGQASVQIEENDTIKTLYDKIELLGFELLKKFLPELKSGNIKFIKQDESKRRIFPQRNPADGLIDWNWDSRKIKNFIRAQTKPYPGAFTIIKNKKIILWDADIIDLPLTT